RGLRMSRVRRGVLETWWSGEAWPVVRVEFRRAVALLSEIRRAVWFDCQERDAPARRRGRWCVSRDGRPGSLRSLGDARDNRADRESDISDVAIGVQPASTSARPGARNASAGFGGRL